MAKRFHDNEIWSQDWFIDMPTEYKLLCFWVKDKCDHAGFWKPDTKIFERMNHVKVDLNEAIKLYNDGKERFIITKLGHWFIPDFFFFQYGNKFNIKNRLHESVLKILEKEGISTNMLRGLIDLNLTSNRPLIEDTDTLKDKVKDKELIYNSKEVENTLTEKEFFEKVPVWTEDIKNGKDFKFSELVEQVIREGREIEVQPDWVEKHLTKINRDGFKNFKISAFRNSLITYLITLTESAQASFNNGKSNSKNGEPKFAGRLTENQVREGLANFITKPSDT